MLFKKGDIVTNGKEHFRIVSIDDKYMRIVNVNEPDDSTSVKEIARFLWNKYTIVSADHQPPEAKANKASKFSFSFDPETGEIIVTWPDGVKEERLQSIKGDKGESVFEEWCRKSGFKPDANSWQVFLKSLRGEDGQFIRGADAPTLYEEWKGHQPEGVDTSYTAFFNQIRGEKGKDGYDGKDGMSAYEFWKSKQSKDADTSETAFWKFLKGNPGEQGPRGHNGQDGDTWTPIFSTDGHQLFFKNQRGDIKGPFDVVGATGKTGPQGPRGESAYQIWLNEGNKGDFHDFLLWIAKQAQKGDNGKDGDTFRPHIEKGGHLFFISDKTGERIDIGWIKGDKGDQGETGLNGHNVTHKYGYKEIYDWTCPVQEINPHLIASSDDLASGGSAEKHMRETLNRIKNIRKQGEKKESRGSWIQEAFWWCSGADRRLLRMCPAEHSKYMGIGTVIFFTAIMAMISSFFAISYVFGNADMSSDKWQTWVFSIAFAIMWGLMIFFLDRFITNTMYSDGKVTISWLELRSALPRILISIFLGIVISAPLELKIFEKEVELQASSILEAEAREKSKAFAEEANLSFNEQLKPVNNSINQYENLKKQKESRLKRIKNGCPPPSYARSKDRVNSKTGETLKGSEYVQNQKEIDDYNNTHRPIIAQLNTEIQSSDSVVANLQAEHDSIERRRASFIAQKELELQNRYKKENSAGLFIRLKALHNIAFNEGKADGYHAWKYGIMIPDTIITYDKQVFSKSNISADTSAQKRKQAELKYSDTVVATATDSQHDSTFSDSITLAEPVGTAGQKIEDIQANNVKNIQISKKFNWSLGNPLFWFILIFALLVVCTIPFMKNVTRDSDDNNSSKKKSLSEEEIKALKRKGRLVTYPWFAVTAFVCAICCNTFFNALPYYIFSAVGMIMMLFILIDVSPVFYKMMLADGQYEQYLHKEKSITQDLVRLNFAKSIAKVNESEIGRLAPLIFSKPFEKIKEILQGSKKKESLEWTVDENDNDIRIASQTIRESNEEVFATVLRMKKAIIEASYQAWYRDMRDAIMGMHKPGFGDGGSGVDSSNTNTPPNTPPDSPSSPDDGNGIDMPHGHYNSEDEPFSRDNYYGNRSGTSPDYDASSDDPNPGTPEDILMDEETRHSNPSYSNPDDTEDKDDYGEESESDSETIETEEDFTTSKEGEDNEDEDSDRDDVEDDSDATTGDDSSTNGTSTSHPDSDVEREVIDDDDDDTIKPR